MSSIPGAPWETARILVVDDEPANVRLLQRLLAANGCAQVEATTDSREALPLFRAFRPDLVLLDLAMPYLDGTAVLQQIRAEMPPDVYLPVLILTADITLEAKRRTLAAGANDFLTKPFEQIEVVLRIGNLLATRRLYEALEAQKHSLEQTVRERTERLVQSEKVATMGSLLAGVAHELNNPLAILSGHAQLLQATEVDPVIARRAEKIAGAAQRCVRIVRNFLSLARQRQPERAQIRLRDVIEGAVELLAYGVRADDIEIVIDIDARVPSLWADPHQLHQVFVNLIGNAQQALRRQSGRRRITVSARVDDAQRFVRISVVDTGPGIPADIRDRIFEPFFTTKPLGEGTGLGLSLCRGIIEDHGGTMSLDSSPPEPGATFVLELPIVTARPASATTPADQPLPPVRPRSVLVVDDEQDVAAVIAETMQRDGHRTDVARNGAMALEMLTRQAYDLVISDTRMPVVDGETFYGELRRQFPALANRIIFLTGDVLSREKREFLERTAAPYLTKPFDLGEVRRLAHRLLSGATAPGEGARGT